jgi:hypothetical protein
VCVGHPFYLLNPLFFVELGTNLTIFEDNPASYFFGFLRTVTYMRKLLGGSNIVAIVMRGNGDGKILNSCYSHVMTTG